MLYLQIMYSTVLYIYIYVTGRQRAQTKQNNNMSRYRFAIIIYCTGSGPHFAYYDILYLMVYNNVNSLNTFGRDRSWRRRRRWNGWSRSKSRCHRRKRQVIRWDPFKQNNITQWMWYTHRLEKWPKFSSSHYYPLSHH